jgi:multicomponent Na+:H+ antiporter subunit G
MSVVQTGLAILLVVSGMFFLLLGSVGILRFPDFFTRLHPAGKADTLGASLLLIGLAVYEGFSLLAVKIVLVQIFIFMANPAAAHALGRAAWRGGLRPWTGKEGEPVEAHLEASTPEDRR